MPEITFLRTQQKSPSDGQIRDQFPAWRRFPGRDASRIDCGRRRGRGLLASLNDPECKTLRVGQHQTERVHAQFYHLAGFFVL